MGSVRTALCRVVAAVVVGSVCLVGAPASAAVSGDWTQNGFGSQNTSYNPSESIINGATINSITPSWSVTPDADEESCSSLAIPPVVAGGRVFISEAGGVSAYSTADGHKLWGMPGDYWDVGLHQLAVSGNVLVAVGAFCFSATNSYSVITAYDVRTGAHVWSKGLDPVSTLVIDGGQVIASVEGGFGTSAGITAFRLSDGRVSWERADVFTPNPVSAGGRLLVKNTAGDEVIGGSKAIAVRTGAILWKTPKTYAVRSADPAGKTFYATDPAGNLVALNAANGKVRWSKPISVNSDPFDGVAVTNDEKRLYIPFGSVLTAYDAKNGKKVWSRNMGSNVGWPVRAGGLVYAELEAGGHAILHAATGAPAAPTWTLAASGRPVVSGGRIFLTDEFDTQTYIP